MIVRIGDGRARLLPEAVSLRLLPPVTFAIPFFILYSASGLLDTRTGLVLVNLLANIPLGLLIFVSFIQELPQELEESAFLDGATAADRKSTRLNSSHLGISYAVFCLKK